MQGRVKPNNTDSLFRLTGGQLFQDPNAGNFRIDTTLGLPDSIGVWPEVLDSLDSKIAAFGVNVGPGDFVLDHKKLTQTILDNIPGLNDGITGNDTVFSNIGSMSSNYHIITYNVASGTWKTETQSPNQQVFELNPIYYAWYEHIDTSYKNNSGSSYTRIRWGDSDIKQDNVFQPDWLTVSEITSDSTNTLINGFDNTLVLDGDYLVDFEGFTPQVGDTFILMMADSISSNNTGTLFDNVYFEDFNPYSYSLEVISYNGVQALSLVLSATPVPVDLLQFTAEAEGETSMLYWSTATELNSDYFSIERSTEIKDWKELGRVKGGGNSSSILHYNFRDDSPVIGKNFYRLAQHDFDGSLNYSHVELVSFDNHHIRVWPNPTSQSFFIETDNSIDEIAFSNQIGKSMLKHCTLHTTKDGYYLETLGLSPGIYFVTVGQYTVKLILD